MYNDDSNTRRKNRARIVEITKILFIEQGIAHTSVMDIVKKAKIERKTFYNYFNNIEEIADYIYFLSYNKFYHEGFHKTCYDKHDTGFDKVAYYLTTLCEHYEKYNQEMLFTVHYDYYFKKPVSDEIRSKIHSINQVADPDIFFIEGIEDGSIYINGRDPKYTFLVIAQSIGAYASRVLLRGFKYDMKGLDLDFSSVYDVKDMVLDSIRAKK